MAARNRGAAARRPDDPGVGVPRLLRQARRAARRHRLRVAVPGRAPGGPRHAWPRSAAARRPRVVEGHRRPRRHCAVVAHRVVARRLARLRDDRVGDPDPAGLLGQPSATPAYRRNHWP